MKTTLLTAAIIALAIYEYCVQSGDKDDKRNIKRIVVGTYYTLGMQ